MLDWLKIIADVTGLASLWSKYFEKKKEQETGAKLQQGATDAATLSKIDAVSRPIGRDESDELWKRNKEKYGQPTVTGECDGE